MAAAGAFVWINVFNGTLPFPLPAPAPKQTAKRVKIPSPPPAAPVKKSVLPAPQPGSGSQPAAQPGSQPQQSGGQQRPVQTVSPAGPQVPYPKTGIPTPPSDITVTEIDPRKTAPQTPAAPAVETTEKQQPDTEAATTQQVSENEGTRPAAADQPVPAAMPEAVKDAPIVPQQVPYFTIQVGAFRKKTYAQNARDRLADKGYGAYILKAGDNQNRPWYFVRFGEFYDRKKAAESLAGFKEKENLSGIITKFKAK